MGAKPEGMMLTLRNPTYPTSCASGSFEQCAPTVSLFRLAHFRRTASRTEATLSTRS